MENHTEPKETEVKSLTDLASEYSITRNLEVREKLAKQALPFSEAIAKKVIKKLPRHVRLEDVSSDANFGLAKAIEEYKHEKGVKFESFAGHRIYGAIINGLRERTNSRRKIKVIAMGNLLSDEYSEDFHNPDLTDRLRQKYDESNPAEILERKELFDLFKQDISRLSQRHQELFISYFLNGKTQKEAGAEIGISVSGAMKLLKKYSAPEYLRRTYAYANA